MCLADIGLLNSEEIQLLTESLQPVFVLELPPVAETLIQRELLQAFPAICPDSGLVCFALATTDKGAACVAPRSEGPVLHYSKPHLKATPERLKRKRMIARSAWGGLRVLAFALLGFNGCSYHSAPKLIVADGASYVACSGVVHVSPDAGPFGSDTTYSISFTNNDNVDTVVKGVRNVTITSMPAAIKNGLRAHPSDARTDTGKDQTPFVEGTTYLSGPGDKLMAFRNGKWVAENNTECYVSR